jgi:hypothetical protein
MYQFKKITFVFLALATLNLTSCLHIIEEVTFKKNGSGTYAMTLDMGELKGMVDMFKNFKPDDIVKPMKSDSSSTDDGITEVKPPEKKDGLPDIDPSNPFGQLGDQLGGVSESLSSIDGISNVKSIKDSVEFKFGYTFDFANMAALNKAIRVINKERYDSKAEETFKYNGKSFERLPVGDMGSEIKKAMSGDNGGSEEINLDMLKMFLGEMSYKQIYNFPDSKVKKSSNALSEMSADGKKVTIVLKPFNEEQAKKKAGVATAIKLR